MKKLTKLLLLFLVLSKVSFSQRLRIENSSTPNIFISFENILSFEVTSFGENVEVGNFTLQISDLKGQNVVTYNGNCQFKTGKNVFRNSIRNHTRIVSPKFRDFLNTTGILPSGEYEICLDFESTNEPPWSFSDCFFVDSQPQFDLILNLPEDQSILKKEELPLFNWQLISPFSLRDVKYEMKLVEVFNEQNLNAAIRGNPQLFGFKNYTLDHYQYQPNNFVLSDGKSYGWTVNAYLNGFLLAQAEPQRFAIEPDSVLKFINLTNSFIDVIDASDGLYYVKEAIKLRFKNVESPVLKYSIFDEKTGNVVSTGELKVTESDDYRAVIALKGLSLKSNSKYIVQCETDVKRQIKFIYVSD